MVEIIKPGLILLLITVTAAFMLGGVYEITKEPIRLQQESDKNAAMSKLIPEASEFSQIELIVNDNGITEIFSGYNNGVCAGYIISSETQGYGGVIGILTAFDMNGSIIDLEILKSSETPGLGENVKNASLTGQFINKFSRITVTKSSPNENEIQAVTSATISSNAVTSAVNASIDYFNAYILGGN